MKIVHIIADYAAGDLAFSEVVSALASVLPDDFSWHCTSVGSFETVATGFLAAQLGLQVPSLRAATTVIYANCAPRKDRAEARQNNEGEGLLFGILTNGVPIVVVNSGYSLSFVRDELAELYSINMERGGSQFRSRDTFPPIVGKVARGDFSFRKDKLDPAAVIPEPPASSIAYIDSFGNIKTTIRSNEALVKSLAPGQRVGVFINGVERVATVAAGSFNVEEGDIAFAPGSSGHTNRFWEIFQRGGSAVATFGLPRVGSFIDLKPH